jgi:methyl-accepting chemotaxis protein
VSASRTSHSIFTLSTWAFVAAPLLLGLSLALVVVAAQTPHSAEAVAAVDATSRVYWVCLPSAACMALAGLWYRLQRMAQRERALLEIIAELAAGNYARAIEVARHDGLYTGHVEVAISRAEQIKADTQAINAGHKAAFTELARALDGLSATLKGQEEAAKETAGVLQQDSAAFQGLVGSVDGLSRSAAESSSSILQMVAINNEVRENVHHLALSVQETSSAIEEMTFSSKEVAKNIEELSTAAEETAASMNQMDVSIGQVEGNANDTSQLSETVSRDAETGVAAIKQTIQGIDKIKDSSRIAAEVIGDLGARISQIGNILNVIDDVAEQTNLLALNAAIIAAQAGEHGRGFAVVADEIKALAERTGASTKEIADLVRTIQDQSRRATDAMAQGVDNVEEGVRLGHNAEDALTKIVDSAKRSTLMIQAIAQATVEQAKGSKQVTNAISRIAETVQQIAYATAEQAKGSEHIMQSAERMRGITQQVERSADEQNRGGRQITQSIEVIQEVTEGLGRIQKTQSAEEPHRLRAATRVVDSSQEGLALYKNIEKLLGKSIADQDTVQVSGRR